MEQRRIDDLIPHRPPITFLDRILEVDDDYARCLATVPGDSPFVCDGAVESVALIEVMGQAIAALAGATNPATTTSKPRVGLLIACREATFHCERVPVGVQLIVEARRGFGKEHVGQFDCRVSLDGTQLAEASLSVAYVDRSS